MIDRRTLMASSVGALCSLFFSRKERLEQGTCDGCKVYLKGKTLGVDPAESEDSKDDALWDWRSEGIIEIDSSTIEMRPEHYFRGGCRVYLDGEDVSLMRIMMAFTGSRGFIYYYPLDGDGQMIILESGDLMKNCKTGHVVVREGRRGRTT